MKELKKIHVASALICSSNGMVMSRGKSNKLGEESGKG
jgi:hypothetical protein